MPQGAPRSVSKSRLVRFRDGQSVRRRRGRRGPRNAVVEEAAVLIPNENEQARTPQRIIAADRVVHVRDELLSGAHMLRRVLAVCASSEYPRLDESVGGKRSARVVRNVIE